MRVLKRSNRGTVDQQHDRIKALKMTGSVARSRLTITADEPSMTTG